MEVIFFASLLLLFLSGLAAIIGIIVRSLVPGWRGKGIAGHVRALLYLGIVTCFFVVAVIFSSRSGNSPRVAEQAHVHNAKAANEWQPVGYDQKVTAPAEEWSQQGELFVDGDLRFFVSTTTLKDTGLQVIGLLHEGESAPRAVYGPGSFLPMPGSHTVTWKLEPGSVYKVPGRAYLGIRADSPRFFDFALVAGPSGTIPREVIARQAKQRLYNSDSLFLSQSFPYVARVAWLCKIEQVSNNETRFVDW